MCGKHNTENWNIFTAWVYMAPSILPIATSCEQLVEYNARGSCCYNWISIQQTPTSKRYAFTEKLPAVDCVTRNFSKFLLRHKTKRTPWRRMRLAMTLFFMCTLHSIRIRKYDSFRWIRTLLLCRPRFRVPYTTSDVYLCARQQNSDHQGSPLHCAPFTLSTWTIRK